MEKLHAYHGNHRVLPDVMNRDDVVQITAWQTVAVERTVLLVPQVRDFALQFCRGFLQGFNGLFHESFEAQIQLVVLIPKIRRLLDFVHQSR